MENSRFVILNVSVDGIALRNTYYSLESVYKVNAWLKEWFAGHEVKITKSIVIDCYLGGVDTEVLLERGTIIDDWHRCITPTPSSISIPTPKLKSKHKKRGHSVWDEFVTCVSDVMEGRPNEHTDELFQMLLELSKKRG